LRRVKVLAAMNDTFVSALLNAAAAAAEAGLSTLISSCRSPVPCRQLVAQAT
jgi:hypothetical protein